MKRLIAALTILAFSGSARTVRIEVNADNPWTNTAIRLLPGAVVRITATGKIECGQTAQPATPDGLARGWKDLLRTLPINDAGRCSLIGRIGDSEFSVPFLVGSKHEIRSTVSGDLFLGLNLQKSDQTTGAFQVTLEVLEPGRERQIKVVEAISGIDTGLFQQLPRRVEDADGRPGDMVNFLLMGAEELIEKAFRSAGWVSVDRTKRDAVLHGLSATLSKQAYVGLPMSELFLFGRPQDFGYAHAEPFKVVASRHHLRLWRAPFELQGVALWAGAATHDVGFEKDERNGRLTHKIDPAVDLEREYVKNSLLATGLVSTITYFRPPDAVTSAATATGEPYRSDGRVLVLVFGQ